MKHPDMYHETTASPDTTSGSALQESDERFRLMADTAPVMIWMTGIDSLCTFLNKT